MEMVLDVYKRPFDSRFPVVCMDESPKQLIGETKVSITASPGHPAKDDYEYKRCGVCNIFMACEPLAGKRIGKITKRKTKRDWAYFLEEIAAQYENAEKSIVSFFFMLPLPLLHVVNFFTGHSTPIPSQRHP